MLHPSSVFQPIKVVLPADIDATYSNAAVLRYSATEIALDFTRFLPGGVKRKVEARIVMTPTSATLLLAALRDRLSRYEAEYGNIRLPGDNCSGSAQHGNEDPKRILPLLPPPAAKRDSSNGRQSAPASPRQEVEVPADLETVNSNFAIIRSSAVDVVIDFACVGPNAFKTEVCKRVVLSPGGAKLLRQTLEGGLSRYEDKHGRIAPPKDIKGDDELPGLNLWGGPVPFSLN